MAYAKNKKKHPNHQTHQDCNYEESHKEADKHHNQLNAWAKGTEKDVQDKWRSHKGQWEFFHLLI